MSSRLIFTTRKKSIRGFVASGLQASAFPASLLPDLFAGKFIDIKKFWESPWSTDMSIINECLSKGSEEFRFNKDLHLQRIQTRTNGIGILTFSFVPSAVSSQIQPKKKWFVFWLHRNSILCQRMLIQLGQYCQLWWSSSNILCWFSFLWGGFLPGLILELPFKILSQD